METMKATYDSQKETRYFQISVPLTNEEKEQLNLIKRRTGKAIGFFAREAILEKLSRDNGKVVPFEQ